MTTISNSTTLGVTLSSPTYTNPIAIDAGVTISNRGGVGVLGSGQSWTVENGGSISGKYGIRLSAGGSIANVVSGFITATNDILVSGGEGTVINSGNLNNNGFPGYGVYLTAGGSVTNTAGGLITGFGAGIGITNGAGTVVNEGHINESGFYGVRLAAGGSVVNTVSASIVGEIGVSLDRDGTLTNAGTISTVGAPSINQGARGGSSFAVPATID